MAMIDDLRTIAERVKAQRHLMKNEAATVHVAIQPFIEALGYRFSNLAEVYPEYSADAKSTGGDRVDYAIIRDAKPVIFVEAKAANIALNENHWKQLHHYFNAADVKFGILTNGLEFRFYTDLTKPNIMDKEPFLVIDMLELDQRQADQLDSFTRSGFNEERILANARQRAIARVIEQEMANPSDALVRHFARQIRQDTVSQRDLPIYAQLVKQAWQELSGRKTVEPPPRDEEQRKPPPPPGNDIPIFGSHKGHRFEAVMLRTSLANGFNGGSHCIRFKGKLTNGKDAMIAALSTIDSASRPAKNLFGLKFWHVTDPDDGATHPLSVISKHADVKDEHEALRQRLLKKH